MSWRCAVVLCMCVTVVLSGGQSAFALAQRGHVFGFSFGSPGKGEGELAEPSGIAVNDATGDVYVADAKNKVVEQFAPVAGAGGELVGESFVRSLAVRSPSSAAVDNSSAAAGADPSRGDVYVVGGSGSAVYKFSAEGAPVGEPLRKFEVTEDGITSRAKLEGVDGIAVDSAGTLFVWQEDGEIFAFDNEDTNRGLYSLYTGLRGAPGLALDSQGDFFAGVRGEAGLPLIAKLEGITGSVLCDPLEQEASTAVAVNTADVPGNDVDEQNDVYVANVSESSGAQQTTITQLEPAAQCGGEIQRFGHAGLVDGDAIAVDDQTGAVFVADAASDDVDVFELEAPGPPAIEGLSVAGATPASQDARRLSAHIDPRGSETLYGFEYGTGSCSAAPSTCTKSAPTELSGTFGKQEVSLELQGLEPGTYHYRVVARNALGTTESVEASFTILTPLGQLPDGRAWELVSPPAKHGADISALTAEGGVILASEDGDALTYVTTGAAVSEEAEGNGAPEDQQVLATRGADGWASQDIATPNQVEKGVVPGKRPEYEFFSPDLSLALVTPSNDVSPSLLAPGISAATSYLRDDPPLEPGEAERQSFEAAAANSAFLAPGYLALAPGSIAFEGASEDLAHIVLSASTALGGEGSGPGLYEWSSGGRLQYLAAPEGVNMSEAALGYDDHVIAHAISADGSRVIWSSSVSNPHLYMSDTATGQALQLDRAQGVSEPSSGGAYFQTASADGSKVFFTDDQTLVKGATGSQGLADLYVCEVGEEGGEAVCDLRDLTADVAHEGEHAAVQGLLLGASEDGSTVYLVAQGVLAGNENANHETAEAGQENLYVLHQSGGEWFTSFIAILSPQDMEGTGNYVTGQRHLSARVSPNGRYLAFMSNRPLTGYDNEDLSSAHEGERLDEEVFLYDSQTASLTCVSCYPDGERPQGVFDTLSSGEGLGLLVDRPGVWTGHGREDWLAGSIPGWTAEDLNGAFYQSRYLNDEGRLFFDAAGPLLPAVEAPTRPEEVNGTIERVGVENVYEYEPAGAGSCHSATGACVALISSGTSEQESAFLEATPSGEDVFFLTAAQLLPQDTETGRAIYDARVCSSLSPCLTPPLAPPSPCGSTESCRPAQPAQQAPAGPPASSTLTGAGNLAPARQRVQGVKSAKPPSHSKPPSRAQKLAKALHACGKQRSERKRARCEAHARRLYGPKPKAKAKHGHARKASRR